MKKRNLGSYIAENFKQLQVAAIETKQPLFRGELEPEQYEDTVKVLTALSKNMTGIPLQVEKIHAILASLNEHNRSIFSGDTGIGKTFVGIATAFVRAVQKLSVNPDGHYNAYVVAPPHLVKKWGNEARKMLKGVIEVNVIEVKTFKDVYSLTKKADYIKGFNLFVVSKNKNSLTYQTKTVFQTKKWFYNKEIEKDGELYTRKGYEWKYLCPHCGTELVKSTKINKEGLTEPKEFPYKRKNSGKRCGRCGNKLTKPVRGKTSPAEFINRYGKTNCIDMLIIDELHEEKAKNTLRASAFGQLIAKSNEVLGLTGTFLGGYASHAFYTLFRMFPTLFLNDLYMGWTDVEKFIQEFGGSETLTQILEFDEVNQCPTGEGLGRNYGVRERADLSPRLLDILLPMIVFARLDELKFLNKNAELPKYTEISHKVPHEPEFSAAQGDYLIELAKASNYEFKTFKDRTGYGKMKTDALLIPDLPFKETSIMLFDEDGEKEIKYVPPFTREEYPITNKERKLVEIINDAHSQNKKCLVYHDFVNSGLREDLMEIISKETGLKIEELKSSIAADKREAWLKSIECDVLITNPELVKTGLDLLEYPTIIFYEQAYSSYNVFTMRQAAKRAWRIGQTVDCEVHSIAYAGTAQQHALNLIGSKMNISQGVEGRLSTGSDIASEAEEENLQIAMARALLNNEKIKAEAGSSSKTLDLNAREWSEFEKFYIKHLEEYKVNPDEYTKLIPVLKPTKVTKKVAKTPSISTVSIAPSISADTTTVVEPEMLKKAGETIVYIEEKVGKGRLSKRIKKAVSANEASQLAKESGKRIQLSLF